MVFMCLEALLYGNKPEIFIEMVLMSGEKSTDEWREIFMKQPVNKFR